MNDGPVLAAAAPLLAFIVAAAASWWLTTPRGRALAPLDQPNHRSLHRVPVPRSGGLAILCALAVVLLCARVMGYLAPVLLWLALALALLGLVAWWDDRRGLSPGPRLLAQTGAALLVALPAGLAWTTPALPGWYLTAPPAVAVVLAILVLLWMINLYNFMDGMDGLAASMAIFGFGALALLGWTADQADYALAAACIAAAAAGFLITNFPPARLFMGDVGSQTLGLLAATFALWGDQLGILPLWVAALAFSPFILDATWTLLARASRGERVWEAHRSHHYQRLVLAGWSHRRTLLHAYPLMAAAAACAVAAPRLSTSEQWILLAGWAILYFLVHLRVGLIARRAAQDAP